MIRYLLLGVVQGVAEFLPISSSGHLVLAERLLRVDPPGVLLEVVLHLATLFPVLWVLRRDIARVLGSLTRAGESGSRREFALLLLASVPIVVAGLVARDAVEEAFSSIRVVGAGLLLTGALLSAAAWGARRGGRRRVSLVDSLVIGLAQAAALIPGLSRSGATISAGILRGLRGEEAARFSLLLSIPAVLGAVTLAAVRLGAAGPATVSREAWGGLLLCAVVAALVGVVAVKGLIALAARGRLTPFAAYCAAVGTAALLLG